MTDRIIIIQEGTKLDTKQINDLFPDANLQAQLIDYSVLKPVSKGVKRVSYVGVSTWEDKVHLFMPKVWPGTHEEFRDKGIRVIIQTLRKYALSENNNKKLSKDHDEACFLKANNEAPPINRLALSDWLIKDYLERGLYQRKEIIHKKNGRGQINWARTVNQSYPYISNSQPIYLDYVTRSKSSDSVNTLRQLHFFAIKECLKEWAPMLGFESISVENETVTPFSQLPDKAYIRAVLQRALVHTYSDRLTMLIKMLRTWFNHHEHGRRKTLSLYGTSSFHTVWEKACSDIFKNELDTWKKYIPKPKWQTLGMNAEVEKDTLRPDIIRPLDRRLLLLDAKYYKLESNSDNKLTGNPGVGDVIKQLFYEHVLKPRSEEEGYEGFYNYFIFPSSADILLKVEGKVSMEGLGAGPIFLIYMNIENVLSMYLASNKIDSDLLTSALNIRKT